MRLSAQLRIVSLALGVNLAFALEPAERGASDRGTEVAMRNGMVLIPAGEYAPILRGRDEPERVPVAAFWLDARPVTNAEFLEFVQAHPQWRRGNVSALFADTGYLEVGRCQQTCSDDLIKV